VGDVRLKGNCGHPVLRLTGRLFQIGVHAELQVCPVMERDKGRRRFMIPLLWDIGSSNRRPDAQRCCRRQKAISLPKLPAAKMLKKTALKSVFGMNGGTVPAGTRESKLPRLPPVFWKKAFMRRPIGAIPGIDPSKTGVRTRSQLVRIALEWYKNDLYPG
jgi:hypothetical protein